MSATESTRNPIEAAREIAEHAARLARLELELRTVELRGRAARLGIGAGLGLLAVLLLLVCGLAGAAVLLTRAAVKGSGDGAD